MPAFSRGKGHRLACDGFPAPPPQVLAFFRFSGLLLGYAVLRLQHWWVIAVRCHFPGSSGALVSWCKGRGADSLASLRFPSLRPPSPGQVTTLVSSAFLIVKVILSQVRGSGFGWSGGRGLRDGRLLRDYFSHFGCLPLLSRLG